MSEIQTTPAPWAAIAETAFVRTANDDQFAVASVYGKFGSSSIDETAIANSHLIAAAPDLYAALNEINDTEWIGGKGGFVRARAALAKARGEQ